MATTEEWKERCKPATVEELDKMLAEGDRALAESVYPVSDQDIDWSNVYHLRIIGVDTPQGHSIINASQSKGPYLAPDSNWLLVCVTRFTTPTGYLKQCKPCLKTLSVYRVYMVTELHGLENLKQLTSLNLQDCSSLTELPELGNLIQLTSLNLQDCNRITELPELGNLTHLTTLNLINCYRLTRLPGLRNLTQLTSLSLENCSSLTELPELSNLIQLTTLNLKNCYKLTKLPGLRNLTQLTSLSLEDCDNCTALPGLENLTQMTELNLSGCRRLTELSGLENLTQLTSLDLSNCSGLTKFPEAIRILRSLRCLNLSNMNLLSLPDWLPEIAEHFAIHSRNMWPGTKKASISLENTTVNDIPDMSIFEQPHKVVAEFFRQRIQGKTQPLNEIKVVFLGDGEAGKSHTIARLMNDGGDPVDYMDQSTPGIVIKHKEYTEASRTFRVNYWDFGGQEIMHSMHRIFLTGRTMYVVLLNARDDTQGERAKYWLHNIKSFAPGAPVLLVLNKIDQNENASVDERDLRGRYKKLTQVVRLSARDFTQKEFNESFTKVMLEEIRKTGYLDADWPISWTRVKNQLENMESHYIKWPAYEDICKKYQVIENQQPLLEWFNDLGVSFCCCDENSNLDDYVILRPDWITNALYIILFNRLEGANNGLIPHSAIYSILKTAHNNPAIRCTLPQARYDGGDTQYVLGIMRKFNLSFTDGLENEFIPMLCQQNSTVDVQDYRRDADTLEFNMEFDYLPNNLLHRLMVERRDELDMDNVWRTGARFEIKALGYSAVVVIDSNILRFFIRHTDPMHRPNTYLTMLKDNVDRIVEKMGLKSPSCQLIYKLDSRQDMFDFEMLKAMREAGQKDVFSMTWRKMLPIEHILNQSAPDAIAAEQKLLDDIVRSCQNIQGASTLYRNASEDDRNCRIRDDLFGWGYNIQDQTKRGSSESGKTAGELDLLLFDKARKPWTIIEALRISGGAKGNWNRHLDKLKGGYNYFGARSVYLLTYVDARSDAFPGLWTDYQNHIQKFSSSFRDLSSANRQYIKTAKCQYTSGGIPITVYHIFALVPTQDN